ncbi:MULTISPECIES: hypothetical protein [Streptomyces]|nr:MULTISPECIES: hypothetical protein [Streptomyces]
MCRVHRRTTVQHLRTALMSVAHHRRTGISRTAEQAGALHPVA